MGSDSPHRLSLHTADISTHAPRMGSDPPLARYAILVFLISTHAPRMGIDECIAGGIKDTVISTHAPRMGSDASLLESCLWIIQFQPTLPVWGATAPRTLDPRQPVDFNPRSPYGERLKY